jgi:hypothetical protein
LRLRGHDGWGAFLRGGARIYQPAREVTGVSRRRGTWGTPGERMPRCSYDRGMAGGDNASSWLLVRGRGERRLEPEVLAVELRAHSSTRRPSIQRGDRAVLYAAGWQVVFALADVVSEPENDPARTRWSWRFAIRPVLALTDLREAPPVEAAGVFPRSLGRHSYIRLTDDQFERARAAITAAAEPPPAGRRRRSAHPAPDPARRRG